MKNSFLAAVLISLWTVGPVQAEDICGGYSKELESTLQVDENGKVRDVGVFKRLLARFLPNKSAEAKAQERKTLEATLRKVPQISVSDILALYWPKKWCGAIVAEFRTIRALMASLDRVPAPEKAKAVDLTKAYLRHNIPVGGTFLEKRVQLDLLEELAKKGLVAANSEQMQSLESLRSKAMELRTRLQKNDPYQWPQSEEDFLKLDPTTREKMVAAAKFEIMETENFRNELHQVAKGLPL